MSIKIKQGRPQNFPFLITNYKNSHENIPQRVTLGSQSGALGKGGATLGLQRPSIKPHVPKKYVKSSIETLVSSMTSGAR